MHGNKEDNSTLISLCSSFSMAAKPPFIVQRTPKEAIFAFPASWDAEDWLVDGASLQYGEMEVDPTLFPSLKSVGNGVIASVNGAFLRSFVDVLVSSSRFNDEVHGALLEKRQIVFTGHSSSGSVAVLAALWLLEKRLKHENGDLIYPFCVSFGSPLVGDSVFVHAIQRENWSHCFLNFVMGVDIIPRCLLAPLSGFKEGLQAILNFLCPTNLCFSENDVTSQVTFFYESVLTNALSISNYQACLLMGCVNPLLEVMTGFVKVTPYRPIGTYVFCSTNGRLFSLECSNAILQLLLCSFQIHPEEDVSEFAFKSLKEHLQYDPRIKKCLDVQKIISIDNVNDILLSSFDGVNDEKSPIKILLKDLDLSYGARLSLHAAGEWEKHRLRNQKKIDSNYNKIQEALDFLDDYRTTCEMRGVGYYDMFKLQKGTEDFNANVKRLELAGLWDEIVEMLRRYELPDNFEGRIEWVNLGTRYRNLVEPLDIANYYRHSKNEDTGPYMVKGRPRRYRYTQRWLEHAEQISTGSRNESCFWALVEELCSDTNNYKPFLDMKFRVLELEKELVRWLNEGKLGRDVLLSESTFVKWWRALPKQHKQDSCIAGLVNCEFQ